MSSAKKSPMRLFVSERIVTFKGYVSPLPRDEGDVPVEYLTSDVLHRVRVIVVCILAFLLGLLMGFISHDHIAKFNPGHPVWKSWPLTFTIPYSRLDDKQSDS
jgi:hypothetical protein